MPYVISSTEHLDSWKCQALDHKSWMTWRYAGFPINGE